MKKVYYSFTLIAASVFLLSYTTLSENGRAGVAGSPGETGCNTSGCHTGVGTSGSVNLTSNIPANGFVPGTTYNMTLTVSETGKPLFGMGLEALTTSSTNAGTLIAGAKTKLLSKVIGTVNRTSMVHQFNAGLTANSAVFTFSWTAPTVAAGNVTFYFGGLAANASGTEDAGDNTYMGTKIFSPQSAAVPITATTSVTNVSCFGGTNGSATVTPTGGTTYTYAWSNGQTTQTASNLTMGTYTVTVTSGTQTTTATASITQPTQLVGTMNSPTVLSCAAPNSTVSLSASGGTSPYTYLWSTAANTSSISVTTAGTYTVTLTDSKNCTSVKSATVTGNCTSSTNELDSKQVKISPNPFSNVLTIDILSEKTGKGKAEIFDLLGRSVLLTPLSILAGKNTISMDSHNLQEGTYLLKISVGNNTLTRTIVK